MTRCYARSLTLQVSKQQLTKPTKIERLISIGSILRGHSKVIFKDGLYLNIGGLRGTPFFSLQTLIRFNFLVHTWSPCNKISWNTPKSWTKTVLGTMQKGVL